MLYEIRIKRMLLALAFALGLPTGLLARPAITDFSHGKAGWEIEYTAENAAVDAGHMAPAADLPFVSEMFYAALEGDVNWGSPVELDPSKVFIGFHNGAVGQDVLGPREFPAAYYQKSYTYAAGQEPKRASWEAVDFGPVRFVSPAQDCSGLGVVQVGVVFYYVSRYTFDVRLEYSVDAGASWEVIDAKECYALEDPLKTRQSFKTWERLHLQGLAEKAAGKTDVRFRVRTKAREELEYIKRAQHGAEIFESVGTLSKETYGPDYTVEKKLTFVPGVGVTIAKNSDSITATHYLGVDDFHIGTEPLYLVDYRMNDFMLRYSENIERTVNRSESDWTKDSYWCKTPQGTGDQNLNDRLGHLAVQWASGMPEVCKNYYALLPAGAVGPRVEYVKGVPHLSDGGDTYFAMWTDGTRARVHQVASVQGDGMFRAALGSRITLKIGITNIGDVIKELKTHWKGKKASSETYGERDNIQVWYNSLGYEYVSKMQNDAHLVERSGYTNTTATTRTNFATSSEPLKARRLAGINYDFEELWLYDGVGGSARNNYNSSGDPVSSSDKAIWGTSTGQLPGEEFPEPISFVVRARGFKSIADNYKPLKKENITRYYTLEKSDKQTKICVKDRKTGRGIPHAEVQIAERTKGTSGPWKRWVEKIRTDEFGEWEEELSDGMEYVFSGAALGYLPDSTVHAVVGTGAEEVDVWLDEALICTFAVRDAGVVPPPYNGVAMVMAPGVRQSGRVEEMTMKETAGSTSTARLPVVEMSFPRAGGDYDVFADVPRAMRAHRRVKVDENSCRLAGTEATKDGVIELQLPNAGTLRLRVQDASGNAVPDAEIYLGALRQPALNTADEVWEYAVALDTEYRLTVRADGFANWSELKTWASSAGADHELTVELSSNFCRTNMAITGHDGQPVGGVRVRVAPDDDVAYWTDVHGRVMVPLPNGADGEFTLRMSKDGYEAEDVEVAVQQDEATKDVGRVASRVFDLPMVVTIDDDKLADKAEEIRKVEVRLERLLPAGKAGEELGRPTAGRLTMRVVEGSKYRLVGTLAGYASKAREWVVTSAPAGDTEVELKKVQTVSFEGGVFTVNNDGAKLNSGDDVLKDDELMVGCTLSGDQQVKVVGAVAVAPTVAGEAGKYKVAGDVPVTIEVAVPLRISTDPKVGVKDGAGASDVAEGTLLLDGDVITVPERDGNHRLLTVVGAEKVLPVVAGQPVRWEVHGDVAVDVQVLQVAVSYNKDVALVAQDGHPVESGEMVDAGTVVSISADGGLQPDQVLVVEGATPKAPAAAGEEGYYTVDGDGPLVVKVGYPLENNTSPAVGVKDAAGDPVVARTIVQKGDRLVVPAESGTGLVQVTGARIVGYDKLSGEYTWEATGDGPVEVVVVPGHAVNFAAAEASVKDAWNVVLASGDRRLKGTELTIAATPAGMVPIVSGAKSLGGDRYEVEDEAVSITVGYPLQNATTAVVKNADGTKVMANDTPLPLGTVLRLPESVDGKRVKVLGAAKSTTPNADGTYSWEVNDTEGKVEVVLEEVYQVLDADGLATITDADGPVASEDWREKGTELTVVAKSGKIYVAGAALDAGSYDAATGGGRYTVDASTVVVTSGRAVGNPDGVIAIWNGKTVQDGEIVPEGATLVVNSADGQGNAVTVENATKGAVDPTAGTTEWVVDQAGDPVVKVDGLLVSYEAAEFEVLKPNATGTAGDPGQVVPAGKRQAEGSFIFVKPRTSGDHVFVKGAEYLGTEADGSGKYRLTGKDAAGKACEVEISVGVPFSNATDVPVSVDGRTVTQADGTVIIAGDAVIEADKTDAAGNDVVVDGAQVDADGKLRPDGSGPVSVVVPGYAVGYDGSLVGVREDGKSGGEVAPGTKVKKPQVLYIAPAKDGQYVLVSGAKAVDVDAYGVGTYELAGAVDVQVGVACENPAGVAVTDAAGNVLANGAILAVGSELHVPLDADGKPVVSEISGATQKGGVWYVDGSGPVVLSVQQGFHLSGLNDTPVSGGEAAGLSVWPNPTRGLVHVDGPAAGSVVVVYGVLGKEVLRAVLDAGGALDLGSLSRGVYLLRAGGRTVRVVKR